MSRFAKRGLTGGLPVGPAMLALLTLSGLAAGPAAATADAEGFFRYGEISVEVHHAYLFRFETGVVPDAIESVIFLTSRPIDAALAAQAFDVESGVEEQINEGGGGYVRICLSEGAECGLYFSNDDPPESFNTSGYGEFALTVDTPERVEGTHILAEPEDFFDKTYQFDLRFSADLVPALAGKALAEGGGAPGAAYRVYIEAIAKADFPALREMLGEAGSWQLPVDDEATCKEHLKWLRDGTPVTVTISKGEQRQDDAILFVDGVDRDEIQRRGRVQMRMQDGAWRYSTDDLESVDE